MSDILDVKGFDGGLNPGDKKADGQRLPAFQAHEQMDDNEFTEAKINGDSLDTWSWVEFLTYWVYKDYKLFKQECLVEYVCPLMQLACMLSCIQLFATPWTIAHQAPLSLEFSRQEYWSGLPFPFPGDLPEPGIELTSPVYMTCY